LAKQGVFDKRFRFGLHHIMHRATDQGFAQRFGPFYNWSRTFPPLTLY
jgi:hypothetical protein